jgi:uncharacterized membrane protein YuzA (DUF378 family)
MVMAVFATVWWLSGATAMPSGWRPVGIAAGAATGVALVVVVRRYLQPEGEPERMRAAVARLGLINLVQAVAILGVIVGSVRAGAPAWIPTLIAVIVGAHFLPLARLLGWAGYRWTGISMILVGLCGVWLLLTGAGVDTVRITVCLACAVLLWFATLWPVFGAGAAVRGS